MEHLEVCFMYMTADDASFLQPFGVSSFLFKGIFVYYQISIIRKEALACTEKRAIAASHTSFHGSFPLVFLFHGCFELLSLQSFYQNSALDGIVLPEL